MVRRTVRGHGSGVLTDNLYRIECTVIISTSLKIVKYEFKHGPTQDESLLRMHGFIKKDV
jgi:hypothetical protein